MTPGYCYITLVSPSVSNDVNCGKSNTSQNVVLFRSTNTYSFLLGAICFICFAFRDRHLSVSESLLIIL